MACFILGIKKLLNVLSFTKPAENPPEGHVALYLGGNSGNDLVGLNSDGEEVVLATGSVVETEKVYIAYKTNDNYEAQPADCLGEYTLYKDSNGNPILNHNKEVYYHVGTNTTYYIFYTLDREDNYVYALGSEIVDQTTFMTMTTYFIGPYIDGVPLITGEYSGDAGSGMNVSVKLN